MVVLTVVFADLTGSTGVFESLGNARATETVRKSPPGLLNNVKPMAVGLSKRWGMAFWLYFPMVSMPSPLSLNFSVCTPPE